MALEHRKVAWDAGLLTDLSMHVHHKNHDKQDNRLENLEVLTPSAHAVHHAEEDGVVANQYGVFPVKPSDQRSSRLYPSAGAVRPDRECVLCGGVIPGSMRVDSQYCSSDCQVSAWKRLHPEQVRSLNAKSEARRLAVSPPCKVETCDRPSSHVGMCMKHYQRFRKHGDPNVVKRIFRKETS